MSRRVALIAVALAIGMSACNSNLGLGEANCESPDRGVSSRHLLTIQAVPTAKYTPCIRETRVGWDTVEWFARDGEAGMKISRSISPFLTAIVTPSCDVSGSVEVDSGFPDIQRFEDIVEHQPEIGIAIIPSSQRALLKAQMLASELEGAEIDGRPVVLSVDDNIDHQVGPRVNQAFLFDQYAWVISDLDAEEGNVELRGEALPVAGRGLTPAQALDMIEDNVPDVSYKGSWFFVFDGGCITYTFDTGGTLAETIASDAEEVFGFYPASLVVEGAGRQGLIIEADYDR